MNPSGQEKYKSALLILHASALTCEIFLALWNSLNLPKSTTVTVTFNEQHLTRCCLSPNEIWTHFDHSCAEEGQARLPWVRASCADLNLNEVLVSLSVFWSYVDHSPTPWPAAGQTQWSVCLVDMVPSVLQELLQNPNDAALRKLCVEYAAAVNSAPSCRMEVLCGQISQLNVTS